MPSPAAPHAVPLGAAHLTDWGVIRAAGPDARKFLHGQLTQDVELMGMTDARLAGYCSAKGRLLATFVCWREGADNVLLACSADLLPTVLKRLSMFVMRAQCKLTDASQDLPLWGLAGAQALEVAPAAAWSRSDLPGGTALRLPDGAWAGAAVPRTLWVGQAPAGAPLLSLTAWQGLEATSGVARVMAATAEQFVPQMVNLELVDGVNFKKGCYPGQEIVARSQYRGTLKRRAQVVTSTAPLMPGQEVFHDADPGQPAGRVVLAGALPDAGDASRVVHVALVELKLASVSQGELHAGSPEGPVLVLGSLPYELPLDAA